MTQQVSYRFRKSDEHHHVMWLELEGDGMLHECAIMKEDAFGNKYFIRINHLDSIDRRRLASILVSRNAGQFELWDLMGAVTLGNGMNALNYFHQTVKVFTPSGKITALGTGTVGAPIVTGQQSA